MGEPIGALREHALNRKQLLWLLPALASAKGNVRRSSRLDLFALEKASGHDSPGMQVLMGDFLHSAGQVSLYQRQPWHPRQRLLPA